MASSFLRATERQSYEVARRTNFIKNDEVVKDEFRNSAAAEREREGGRETKHYKLIMGNKRKGH